MHFHSNSIWRAARRSDGERAGVNNAEGNGGAARAKWEAGDKRLAPQMRLLTDPTESLLPHSKLSSSKAPAPDVTGESCTRDDQSDSAVEDPSREHKSHAAATTPTAAAECQQEQPEGGAAVVQALSSALGASEVSAVPEEAHATAEASLQKGKMVEEQAANAMQEGAGPIAGVNDDKHDVSPASPAGAEPLGGISGFAEGPGTGEESGPEGATGPRLHHEPAQQLGERVGPLSLPPALLACPASDKTSLALAPVQNPDHRPALVPSPRQHQNDSDDLLPPPPARPLQPPAEDQGHIPLQPRALAPHQPAVERETAQQANAGEEKQGEDAQGSSEVLQTATPRTDEHHASAPVEREGGGYMDMMKDSEASVKVDGRGRGKALVTEGQELRAVKKEQAHMKAADMMEERTRASDEAYQAGTCAEKQPAQQCSALGQHPQHDAVTKDNGHASVNIGPDLGETESEEEFMDDAFLAEVSKLAHMWAQTCTHARTCARACSTASSFQSVNCNQNHCINSFAPPSSSPAKFQTRSA